MSIRESLDEAASAVRACDERTPEVALVLGSGLGDLADEIEDRVAIPYRDIDAMPVSKVAGHAGNLVLGRAEGVPIVAMQGRVHLYEGFTAGEVAFGARLMIALGARTLIITNAAGGVDEGFRPGDLMGIEDHLNLTGRNCLVGENDDTMGPRFVDMTQAYDRELLQLAERTARGLGFTLRRGIYAGLLGPSYETPAEVRMARILGASAVGMSTVLEVIAARHLGARVLGISCITNQAAGISGKELSHEEVAETAGHARGRFGSLVRGVLRGMVAP